MSSFLKRIHYTIRNGAILQQKCVKWMILDWQRQCCTKSQTLKLSYDLSYSIKNHKQCAFCSATGAGRAARVPVRGSEQEVQQLVPSLFQDHGQRPGFSAALQTLWPYRCHQNTGEIKHKLYLRAKNLSDTNPLLSCIVMCVVLPMPDALQIQRVSIGDMLGMMRYRTLVSPNLI